MADLQLKLADEHATKTKEEISALLDAEVDRFSTFMDNLDDWKAKGALSKPERALIKTYLVQKLTGKIDGAA